MILCNNAKRKGQRINVTLFELLFGIAFYGLIGIMLIVPLIDDGGRSLEGFLIGIVMACGMIIHMYVELEKALYMDEMGALKHTRMTTCFRMVVVAAIAIAAGFANKDVISLFVGIMSLKVSAYIQPLTHKFFNKIKRKGR